MKKTLIIGCLFCVLSFCQSVLAGPGLFFNVTSTGLTLSIRTTIPNRTYNQAGIKVRTSGYSLRNAGTECTMNPNGYCIFPVSDTSPRTITLNGSAGTVSITLCLNGSGPLSCQNYNNVSISAIPRFAYVTNAQNGVNDRVSLCPVNTDGTFGACVDSGNTGVPFAAPFDIVLNSSQTIAYIANEANDTVSVCPINANGTFGACIDSGNTGVAFNGPLGLALNNSGTIAYVSNNGIGANNVLVCPINANGTFGACIDSARTGVGFANPAGMSLNNNNTLAYISNVSNNTVTVCPINPNGTFGACVDSGNSGTAFDFPVGLVFNNSGSIAYVANLVSGPGSDRVLVCPVNGSGTFGACIDSGNTGAPYSNPAGLFINPTGANIWVTNSSNATVLVCPINATGTFGACVDSGNTGLPFILPRGIAISMQL